MIYACMRAWRECPNLLLWNIGAWGILALLASNAPDHFASQPPWAALGPTSPPITEVLHGAVHSEAFQFAQLGVAICFFLLMIFAVMRGVCRRLLRTSVASQSVSLRSRVEAQ